MELTFQTRDPPHHPHLKGQEQYVSSISLLYVQSSRLKVDIKTHEYNKKEIHLPVNSN